MDTEPGRSEALGVVQEQRENPWVQSRTLPGCNGKPLCEPIRKADALGWRTLKGRERCGPEGQGAGWRGAFRTA